MPAIPSSSPHYAIAGAGFSGAVLARELVTKSDCRVTIFEERGHTAGNCHTARDAATDVMIHTYGPHIFNTNSEAVWNYVNRFSPFRPFVHRVKATTARGVFSLPINLQTINQFFGKNFRPAEARSFVASLGDTRIGEPANFEEQALKFVGPELYEAFFYGYTKKQWGCEPRELPASILKRLPLRFNYDDNYYAMRFQGIPENGYSSIVDAVLQHPQIEVRLGENFDPASKKEFTHVFFTGPLDGFYRFRLGRLGYRTVSFERIDAKGDLQGCAQMNYPDVGVPHTRICEHKHFAPWENHERTVAFREYSRETAPADVPFYPKRLLPDLVLLKKYRALAEESPNVSFLGRLATYRYMDMEKVIGEALDFSARFLAARASGTAVPQFPNAEP